MYPVRSGIGCPMSSPGIVRIGSCVKRARPAADAARALVERGEVGVHVARVALAARDLAVARRHLAQRLAVVGHVGEDDQHVPSFVEREVLGRRQRVARRRAGAACPARRRGSGTCAVWPSAPLDSIASRNCSAVSCGTPMPAKTIAKLSSRCVAAQPRPLGDLGGQPVVRQAARGEERQLLSAHEAVHHVDGRDAGLDEIARQARARPD